MLIKLVTKLLIIVFALLFSASVIPGITITGLYPAIIAAILLGIINLLIRPILVILTFPITILTLGLFIFIINALLFWFVASFVDGFTVSSFFAAFLGTVVVSITSWVANRIIPE